ncbi:uncharacterized protein [Littorina saxatilis]|uniref:uncharacterized protein n=1 Tax=Littorina saxatilis TaxID=31220 RepID=UPI0038B55B83
MIPVPSFVQLLCLATVLILSSAQVSSSAQSRASAHPSRASKADGGKYAHWGPQYFLGWLPMRTRRTMIDNRITTFPQSPQPYTREVSPEASDMGESIMDEFLIFLTLKDAGLLDLCLKFKR